MHNTYSKKQSYHYAKRKQIPRVIDTRRWQIIAPFLHSPLFQPLYHWKQKIQRRIRRALRFTSVISARKKRGSRTLWRVNRRALSVSRVHRKKQRGATFLRRRHDRKACRGFLKNRRLTGRRSKTCARAAVRTVCIPFFLGHERVVKCARGCRGGWVGIFRWWFAF